MSKTAQRTDPKLLDKVKSEVTRNGKGGEPGQWSARKAQLAVQEYKKRGGGYIGRKSDDNQLKRWTEEDWGTKSGRKSRDSGERYLQEGAGRVVGRGVCQDERQKTRRHQKGQAVFRSAQ